jgi:cytochrome c biogenesis protein
MTVSTHGLRLKNGSHALRAAVELLSSMRFSISLLTVICIASVIGTVLKQNEPINNYINQFGPFWAQVFGSASLTSVYSAWWFMLILTFLVISTSLCVTRNIPKIMRDWGVYKEGMREQSLKAFSHTAQASLNESSTTAAQRIGQTLAQGGWRVKLQERSNGWMVAAKAGRVNKLGYIAAHSAIVLVCIGGLLDGDLIVRAQMLWNGKTAYSGGGLISDVKPEHRLSTSNPTFRANLLVAEGAQSSTAILNQGSGVLIQDLPFSIELKKFVVEHYSTGMPKLFASDIVIHDKATGEKMPARVEVNHPVNYKGVEIYQSSFDDGGSTVKLKSIPLNSTAKSFDVEGVIGNSTELLNDKGDKAGKDGKNDKLTLEFAALRVLNVENFGKDGAGQSGSAVDVRKVDLRESIDSRMGAANKIKTSKELRNVGPSVTYKLRDAAGQAKEFHNYMLPVKMGDADTDLPMYLLGMRESPSEAFRYLRIPVDDSGGMDGFLKLRAALLDPFKRDMAVARYSQKAAGPDRPDMARQLALSASRALSLFAGSPSSEALVGSAVAPPEIATPKTAGLQAVADFIEKNVPVAEREKASEVLIRILNGTLFELAQITRAEAGLKPLELDDKTQAYMMQSVLSLSDAAIYPAPMAFMLKDFTQVQASVFQVARAPGKNIVYLGCFFLILGVFAMLYIRERRVWVWLSSNGNQTDVSMALSTNRKTMDGDQEFGHLTEKLIGVQPDIHKLTAQNSLAR